METQMLADFQERVQTLMTQARHVLDAGRSLLQEYETMGYGSLPPNAYPPEGMTPQELQAGTASLLAVSQLFSSQPELRRGVYLAQRRNR